MLCARSILSPPCPTTNNAHRAHKNPNGILVPSPLPRRTLVAVVEAPERLVNDALRGILTRRHALLSPWIWRAGLKTAKALRSVLRRPK